MSYKCSNCGSDLTYLNDDIHLFCEFCRSKVINSDVLNREKRVIIDVGDYKYFKICDEDVKVLAIVVDNDLDHQAKLLNDMFALIKKKEFEEAKKIVYILDRKLNCYNTSFNSLLRVGMILIKFELSDVDEIKSRTRPMNDENLAYLIKGSSIMGDKIVAYNQRIITNNKKMMLENVEKEANIYFKVTEENKELMAKTNDDYRRYLKMVKVYINDFAKTHDVCDVYFSKRDEQASSNLEREDYNDYMVLNDDVFDYYSMFE